VNLLEDFKAFLRENLPHVDSFHPHFNAALSQMLLAGGKHFRAMLIIGVVATAKKQYLSEAMRVALGYELMHTYSLIHDDLPTMDNAPLRRGQPTLHITYDEVTAILVGDALNTHAFYEISRSNLPPQITIKCIEILAENAGIYGMALGQAIDCYFENKKLNLEQLKFLHIHKTARLIAAALKTGAVIAEFSQMECDKIYQIGLDLGLAFQIQDDIIDATADESEAGKPTHNDVVKNSFTNLLGINGAIDAKNELIAKIKQNLHKCKPNLETMIFELIDKHLKN
jgi:geranyltranstransferase